ncbi:D-alanyl-D-alanine carboxypeptidase / D-alanyl-D-alanine-endopeptidase (penicillin-binding protein 4) [Palleronia marisminoris]|uniref:D-alanyl-D-alanine carboxypeptidase n=1 Tax=Palleronia marisminoris TaxID=315423 RepID=A0A1Y5SJ59_9RHOB|nr:D-alanyl-D-alanine carboxypeptidase/D-alanyl-D-alanine-endopeptidase [Palleronia marisminoris]SFG79454.1 D-alanyl-D-alanine carboxypeptidase / D-alanyl-D-alanine-endopeptidase (penicillin-binding protein 4) [Palleronia marisminoris]SLN39047.1 D-alanyl-D-alanine carboxypeptidase precursor [Palleronia marisminoris]
MRLSRRQMLAGLLSASATGAWAEAPTRSIRPRLRGSEPPKEPIPTGKDLVEGSSLSGTVAFAVADAATGEVLESHNYALGMPPASTAKALTTMWALEQLGAQHRFDTRLVATGPVVNGRIEGDLILAGGGDPTLDTDGLMAMAVALKEMGVREIGGRMRVWSGALPNLYEIDEEQPRHVAYNPAIGGLNLNYNRVHFGWERQGGAYEVTMDSPGIRETAAVTVAQMEVADRAGPVYTYNRGERIDEWTVARTALGNAGSRWLPVRFPALYAGEVFQTLAQSQGIISGGVVDYADHAQGDVLQVHRSNVLPPILADMLNYSTNITAEVVGVSASQTEGPVESLVESAGRMNDWLKREHGLRNVALEDHSGLGDDSRISPADMVRAMVASHDGGALKSLMKGFPLDDTRFTVTAKTGTLNFVSALTGYITGPTDGRTLAFAIFTGDIPRRDALTVEQRERPEGGRSWIGSSKYLQRQLLESWGKAHLT